MSSAPRPEAPGHDSTASTPNHDHTAATGHLPPRTERAATEALAVVQTAPALFEVYNATGECYTVDLEEPACLCPDFRYRSEQTGRCKHIDRCRMTISEYPIPFDHCDVDTTLVHQNVMYQTRGPAGLGYVGGDA